MEELTAAWHAATGYECIPQELDTKQLEHSSDLLFCEDGTYFTLYETGEDLQKQLQIKDDLIRNLNDSDYWVLGENWAIAEAYSTSGDQPMGSTIKLGATQ